MMKITWVQTCMISRVAWPDRGACIKGQRYKQDEGSKFKLRGRVKSSGCEFEASCLGFRQWCRVSSRSCLCIFQVPLMFQIGCWVLYVCMFLLWFFQSLQGFRVAEAVRDCVISECGAIVLFQLFALFLPGSVFWIVSR